jgi:N-acetylmuramoyl-L-alanine amidase
MVAAVATACAAGASERQPRAAAAQPPTATPSTPSASDARLAGDVQRTRLIVDLDRRVDVTAFLMADPVRVVVDLPEIQFRLSETSGREGRGLVTAYRFGLFAPGRSRIVIDAAERVLIDKAFVVPAAEGQPHRLVVDIVRASEAEFRAAVERDALAMSQRSHAQRSGAPPASAPARNATAGRRGAAELPLIVLDPGHGGVDSGASTADGQLEKALVLDFAKVLRERLEASGRVRVLMTRDDDVFVRLDDRVRFARERQAALFLSIHADSFARPLLGVSGASVYTLSERASDQEAAAYAERENRADMISGVDVPPDADDVADILFDLMHRETKNFSVHFARNLVEELRPHVRMVRNPHRFAGFRVLRAPDVPSALLELGYLSSRQDVRQLTSAEWRRTTSDAIARSILAFVSTLQRDGAAAAR